MLTRSKAATEKAAAAATSAPTPPSAAQTNNSSTAAPAATDEGTEGEEAEIKVNGAGEAGAAESLVTPAVPAALIGRKRTADAAPAACASSPAAASTPVSATTLSSESNALPDGCKRQQLSHSSLSAASDAVEQKCDESMGAAAASSVGPRRPHHTVEAMADVCASLAAIVESKQDSSAGSASSSAAASSSAGSSAPALPSRVGLDLFPDLFDLCCGLVSDGVPLLDSMSREVQYQDLTSPLQSSCCLFWMPDTYPIAQEHAHRHAPSTSIIDVMINTRRAITQVQHEAGAVLKLGRMCGAATSHTLECMRWAPPGDMYSSPPDGMQNWLLRVDALFTQMAERMHSRTHARGVSHMDACRHPCVGAPPHSCADATTEHARRMRRVQR